MRRSWRSGKRRKKSRAVLQKQSATTDECADGIAQSDTSTSYNSLIQQEVILPADRDVDGRGGGKRNVRIEISASRGRRTASGGVLAGRCGHAARRRYRRPDRGAGAKGQRTGVHP